MSDLPPAGWYPDPTGGGDHLRYWDGSHWTEYIHDVRTRLRHDTPEGWQPGPDGNWQPPDDSKTYGVPKRDVLDPGAWDPGVPVGWGNSVPDPTPQSGRAWDLYWTDLKWSARALIASPWLVVIPLVLAAGFELGIRRVHPVALWTLVLIVFEVFLVGFTGTERVWFLRRLRNARMWPREVWTLSWHFFGRFLLLGIFVGLLAAIAFVPVAIATFPHTSQASTSTSVPAGFTIAILAVTLVVDIVLTFVVPALALTSPSVDSSFRIGWRMITRLWPLNAWYLLAPGLTLFALAAALPHSVISTGASVAIGVSSTLLAIWFKGANVAFYVRSVPPASIDGAA